MIINKLAKAFDLNITQLANELGCSRQLLSGTNSGRRPAHARTLKAMIDRLEHMNSEVLEREQNEAALRAMARTAHIRTFKNELIERGLLKNECQTDES